MIVEENRQGRVLILSLESGLGTCDLALLEPSIVEYIILRANNHSLEERWLNVLLSGLCGLFSREMIIFFS